MKTSPGGLAVGVAAALGLSLTGPIGAQASDSDLAEIVVTARRQPELLQDVPISITVLGQIQRIDVAVSALVDLDAGGLPEVDSRQEIYHTAQGLLFTGITTDRRGG